MLYIIAQSKNKKVVYYTVSSVSSQPMILYSPADNDEVLIDEETAETKELISTNNI